MKTGPEVIVLKLRAHLSLHPKKGNLLSPLGCSRTWTETQSWQKGEWGLHMWPDHHTVPKLSHKKREKLLENSLGPGLVALTHNLPPKYKPGLAPCSFCNQVNSGSSGHRHACNRNSLETKSRGSLQYGGQPGLHRRVSHQIL